MKSVATTRMVGLPCRKERARVGWLGVSVPQRWQFKPKAGAKKHARKKVSEPVRPKAHRPAVFARLVCCSPLLAYRVTPFALR